MLETVKALCRAAGLDTRAIYQRLSAASVDAAISEQGLKELVEKLRQVVPDLSDQFTAGLDREEYARYWEIKMRGQHAWQIRCIENSLRVVGGTGLTIADIGDSSGNHGIYVRALAAPETVARYVSVNLDPVAIDKVRSKGGEAVLCRAEELDLEGLRPDLFLSFETIEHLTDPVRFLHDLATKSNAEYLLMTVPFRRRSRFGGAEVRTTDDRLPETMTPEEVHIFELSPEDWRLLARFAGFRTEFGSIYRQYPRYGIWRALAPMWRRLDFEGFYAQLLVRDTTLADRYTGW